MRTGAVAAGAAGYMTGGSFGRAFIAAGIGSAVGAQNIQGADGFILSVVIGGVTSEITGGKFKNGAATAAFMWALRAGANEVSAFARGNGDPKDAMTKYWANRRDLGLEVKDGVLVGEVDVGCKITTDLCSQVFNDLEAINASDKADITFNRHTVYESNSSLDIEVKFTTFPRKGDGSHSLGEFTRGKGGSFLSDPVPGTITLDYRAIGHPYQQGIVLHELGHALGHAHMVNSSNSIMSYSPNGRNNFGDQEMDALIRAYQ